jgi:tRNA uridine 5-carboxymethylaminomethyl modification enzyme
MDRLARVRDGGITLLQILRRPEVRYADLPQRDEELSEEVIRQVEIAVKYQGYIERQELDVGKLKEMEQKQIPPWLDYQSIPSLRIESRQKLERIRPATIGQASRISGVSPADISLVLLWLKRGPQTNVEPFSDTKANVPRGTSDSECCL